MNGAKNNCALYKADLTKADLTEVTLINANLREANLTEAILINPDLRKADLTAANLTGANLQYASLVECNLEVLILGRFSDERKAVLDAIRNELRKLNFTPILFDFDKPASKDLTGTVETLARMARFIIADLTDPSRIPHELATLIPHLRTTPIQLIKMEGSTGYSMIEDYHGSYNWLLKPFLYRDSASLIAALPVVITPANEMAESFRNRV